MKGAAAGRLEASREFCHRCDEETTWSPLRGGRRVRCVGCGDVFPCRSACDHLDCAEARGEGRARAREAV